MKCTEVSASLSLCVLSMKRHQISSFVILLLSNGFLLSSEIHGSSLPTELNMSERVREKWFKLVNSFIFYICGTHRLTCSADLVALPSGREDEDCNSYWTVEDEMNCSTCLHIQEDSFHWMSSTDHCYGGHL